jgi:hypothetical protein
VETDRAPRARAERRAGREGDVDIVMMMGF